MAIGKPVISPYKQITIGRVKHVGALGRIALEVKGTSSNYKVISFADPLDIDRFEPGDVVKFEYDDDGRAVKVRKTSAKDPAPHGWGEKL